jgi:hypothetical protein
MRKLSAIVVCVLLLAGAAYGQMSILPGSSLETVCPGIEREYRVVNIPQGSCKFRWTVSGGTGTSSTNVIKVKWNDNSGWANLKVEVSDCGTAAATASYLINSLAGRKPTTPTFDSYGPLSQCDVRPLFMTVATMSIPGTGTGGIPLVEAGEYQWELSEPLAWTIRRTFNRVELRPVNSCAGGTIKVRAVLRNCTSGPSTSNWSDAVPLRAEATTFRTLSPVGTTTHIHYCGNTAPVTFTAPGLGCVTTYRWTFPAAWATSSGLGSGATTTAPSITLYPPAAGTTAGIEGAIFAEAVDGTCAYKSVEATIQYRNDALPKPVFSSPLNKSVCSGQSREYKVGDVAGAVSYSWYTESLPTGFYTGNVQLNEGLYDNRDMPVTTVTPSITVKAPVLENGRRFGVRLFVRANRVAGCAGSGWAYVDLWVGPPAEAHQYELFVQGARGQNPVTLSADGLYNFQLDPIDGATSYRWFLPTGFSWGNLSSNGYVIQAWTPGTPGRYAITVTPVGLCAEEGGTGHQSLYIIIPGSGPGDPQVPCPRPPCSIGPQPARVPADPSVAESNSLSLVYPNPASSQLTVTFADDARHEVIIYNSLQQPVLSAHGEGSQLQVDIAELPPGFYVVHGVGARGTVREHLQIAR